MKNFQCLSTSQYESTIIVMTLSEQPQFSHCSELNHYSYGAHVVLGL